MEQRQKECETQSTDEEHVKEDEDKDCESNNDGFLQRNERQFYDNLLVNKYCILCDNTQQTKGSTRLNVGCGLECCVQK